jgi:eukaryotic-like serine/threonine-protein kinase
MAIVWLARRAASYGEPLVVVKLLLPQYALDTDFHEMFVDEARIALGIKHPNVASILETAASSEDPYIVMEYIDGESLARLSEVTRKANVPIPIGVALRLVADAAAGLHAAHELSSDGASLHVVHRDVSPQNILVRSVGSAAVIDFGIAKARDRLAEETRAGDLKGKVRYMAPEQALGRPVDRRVDVWALGAVLYELFAGRGPFDGGSDIAALQRLIRGERPAELPAHVPEPVRAVIGQALSHDRERRFSTASALSRALEQAMGLAGLSASTADVAAFIAPFIAERVRSRFASAVAAMAALDGVSPEVIQAAYRDTVPPADLDERTQLLAFDAGPSHGAGAPTRGGLNDTVRMAPTYSSIPAPSQIAASISEALGSGGPRAATEAPPLPSLPPPSSPPSQDLASARGGPQLGGLADLEPETSLGAAAARDAHAGRKLGVVVGAVVLAFVATGALIAALALDKI